MESGGSVVAPDGDSRQALLLQKEVRELLPESRRNDGAEGGEFGAHLPSLLPLRIRTEGTSLVLDWELEVGLVRFT